MIKRYTKPKMDNLPTLKMSTDMTESEVKKVQQFIEDGLPGIAEVRASDISRMLDMYLTGSSYSQISAAMRIRKVFILYLAYKANWETVREEYINEIQEGIKNRLVNVKLKAQEFMILAAQAYQQKMSVHFLNYLSTGNAEEINAVSPKEMLLVMKIIEMNNNLDSDGKDKSGKVPPIGLNPGATGILVERTGENSFSVTPKDGNENVGSLLKRLADEKRAKENNIQEIKKESNNEGK
jgi:hypothetical protein